DGNERHDADRQVDVKDPAPACRRGDEAAHQRTVVGQPAAKRRAGHTRETVDGGEDAGPLGALGGREDGANDGEDERDTKARAQSLQGAEGDQLLNSLSGTTQGRAGEEEHDADDKEALAAELIRELTDNWDNSDRGQQVGGDDPGVAVEAVE